MLKRICSLLLAAALLLSLTGCGGRELYERLLVHGIGVDKDEDGLYRITVRSTLSEDREEIYTCRGETVLDALGTLSLTTGRRPFYAHNYLVVFGMGCAQSGLQECIDFFVRYYGTRPAVQVYVAQGSAEDILCAQREGEYVKMSDFQQLGDSSKENGVSMLTEVLDFVNCALRTGCDPVVPVVAASDSGIEIISTAWFAGYDFRGLMPLDETRGLLAAKNELRNGEAVITGESFGRVTLTLVETLGRIELADTGGEHPEFTLRVETMADVSTASKQGHLEKDVYGEMEQALSHQLKEQIENAIRRTALTDGCDIFGFGNVLYRSDPERWRTVEETWREELPLCSFNIEVNTTIHRLEQEIFGPALG